MILFEGKLVVTSNNEEVIIDEDLATNINFCLIVNGYVNKTGELTDKYYQDKDNDVFMVPDDLVEYKTAIVNILNTIYSPQQIKPENARDNNVELKFNEKKATAIVQHITYNKLGDSEEVSVYVKLPRGFYISTPVGKYNPDWAIAFNKGYDVVDSYQKLMEIVK